MKICEFDFFVLPFFVVAVETITCDVARRDEEARASWQPKRL